MRSFRRRSELSMEEFVYSAREEVTDQHTSDLLASNIMDDRKIDAMDPINFEARAKMFARKQDMDLKGMDSAERAKTFSQNEASLKSFYRSCEPETTQNYRLIEVYRPCTVKMSGKLGLGLFLNERAVPGQLLIVDNAKASCSCVPPEHTPYKPGSYIHAPEAVWMPPSPRIPAKVHQHLTELLTQYCANSHLRDRVQVFNLDSLQYPDGDMDCTRHLWNVVGNNAMCDKVRSLSQDEPRRVEISELWGVWLLPSYINHSCAPNCHRMRVGEAMIIRAATEIAAGEELTLPYFDIFDPHSIRNVNCQTFGFRCDCPRCTFERLLGSSYNDLQRQIIGLKIEMQAAWTMKYVICGSGNVKMLLNQLKDLIVPIQDMIDDILYESQDSIEVYWINASFIDAYLGAYAVSATSSLNDLGADPVDDPGNYKTSQTHLLENLRTEWVMDTAADILEIINEVHPGNMLGQEFYSILLKVFSQLSVEQFETEAESVADYNNQLQTLERNGMQFYSSYYGHPGAETLKSLLATES